MGNCGGKPADENMHSKPSGGQNMNAMGGDAFKAISANIHQMDQQMQGAVGKEERTSPCSLPCAHCHNCDFLAKVVLIARRQGRYAWGYVRYEQPRAGADSILPRLNWQRKGHPLQLRKPVWRALLRRRLRR